MKCSRCNNEAVDGFKMCIKCREKNKIKCKKYAATVNREDVRKKHKVWRDNNKDRIQGYDIKYRSNNSEKEKIRRKKYVDNNREKVRESGKNTYQKYKEKVIARQKKYRDDNKEQCAARARSWYEKNKVLYNLKVVLYRLLNPHVAHKAKMKRRAREFTTQIVPINRLDIFNRDEWMCKICGGAVNPCVSRKHPDYPSIDHIVPLSRGGIHHPDNVQCAHLRCNLSKGSKLPEDIA